MSTSSLEASISLVTETCGGTKNDVDDPYGAFTNINTKVFQEGTAKAIGEISGIAINRQAIAEKCFLETFDAHSADMEWVASALLENRYGRTKLKSLRGAGDDPEFDFFLMQKFWVDSDQSCDVATIALRKFLRSDRIYGHLNFGCWRVSSIAFVLSAHSNDGSENSESGRKRKRDTNSGNASQDRYKEAIPFLRNGFFQDTALVCNDTDNARILVGGVAHFEESVKSQAEVMVNARTIIDGISNTGRKPAGKDDEIFSRVKDLVNMNSELSMNRSMMNISSCMIGLATFTPPTDETPLEQLKSLRKDLTNLIRNGGSISRSTALHVACENNSIKVVRLLLEIDPDCVNSKDSTGRTPLMVAAVKATGRHSFNGISETTVIDDLLEAGANKAEVDSVNMTSYGYFKKNFDMHMEMTRIDKRSTLTNLEHKLYPPGGPTTIDFTSGRGGSTGFVDYGPEDDEADRENGRGVYAVDDGSIY